MDNKDHCNMHKAHHSQALKTDLNKRFKRIEGQIRGINRMIQEDTWCDDVLNQIASAQAAISSARNLLLEAHIKSCIGDAVKENDESVIEELMTTLERMLR